jgi:hypothetical protein
VFVVRWAFDAGHVVAGCLWQERICSLAIKSHLWDVRDFLRKTLDFTHKKACSPNAFTLTGTFSNNSTHLTFNLHYSHAPMDPRQYRSGTLGGAGGQRMYNSAMPYSCSSRAAASRAPQAGYAGRAWGMPTLNREN